MPSRHVTLAPLKQIKQIKQKLVEHRRVELLTSCMPCKRSTN